MYVLVHHHVTDPEDFWATAQAALDRLPAELQLHQTLSARDGRRATCLWEADSVEAVREFIESALGAYSQNEYSEAENREGVVVPAAMQKKAAPA